MDQTNMSAPTVTDQLLKACETAHVEIVMLLPRLQGQYAGNMRAVADLLKVAIDRARKETP